MFLFCNLGKPILDNEADSLSYNSLIIILEVCFFIQKKKSRELAVTLIIFFLNLHRFKYK